MKRRAIAAWLSLGCLTGLALAGSEMAGGQENGWLDEFKDGAGRSLIPAAAPTPEVPVPEVPVPEVPVLEAIAPFPSFNSQRLDQQIRLYARYLATEGRPDVLVIGSSRALQGVDPIVLQEGLAARGIPNQRVYNFSINGATARVVEVLLRRVLLPNQLPRVIVWADGSRAFNNGRPDRTFESITTSPGYRRMTAAANPDSPWENQPVPDVVALMTKVEDLEAGERASDQRASNQTEFPTLRNERVSSQPEPPIPQLPNPPSPNNESTTNQREQDRQAAVEAVLAALPPVLPGDLTANGFQSVTARYNPATYFRQFPRVPGRYDADYVGWRLQGPQEVATVAIAQFARSQRIPLIFVNLPLHRDYLSDRFRRRSEQQFRRHMQRLSTQYAFLYRDLTQRWPTEHNYFADPSHISNLGAQAVARQIAADPGTAWERWLAR